MDPSTTDADNPNIDDAPAESTTVTDPQTSTDNQPGESQQPDPSKSDSPAASDDDKSKETTDKPEDAPASFDDDIDDWISKRGLPTPENDAQKQAYQDMRNGQREFTREQQAKKDVTALGDTVKDANKETLNDEDDDEDDPLEKRLSAVEKQRDEERTTRLQSEFYTTNKINDAEHKAIMEIYKEKVNRPTTEVGKRDALKLWSNPDSLPDLLDLAKARLANSTDNSALKDEAAREEREKIAQESQAKSPSRSATTTSTDDKSAEQTRTDALKARYSSNK